MQIYNQLYFMVSEKFILLFLLFLVTAAIMDSWPGPVVREIWHELVQNKQKLFEVVKICYF